MVKVKGGVFSKQVGLKRRKKSVKIFGNVQDGR